MSNPLFIHCGFTYSFLKYTIEEPIHCLMRNRYTGSIKAILASKDNKTCDEYDEIPERRLTKVDHTLGFRIFDGVGRENKRGGDH